MATVNTVTKYAAEALEAFAMESLTEVFTPRYDWTGAKTVTVFTNNTIALSDYVTSTGYGTPTHVGNTKDDLTVTQDKKFHGVIDKLESDETGYSLNAAAFLGAEARQIVAPSADTYRLAAIVSACPTGQITTGAVTSANAYTKFLAANAAMTDSEVPTVGRIAFVSTGFYSAIKQDDSFIKASDMAQAMLINGQVGTVDGVPLVLVPATRMPSGYSCIVVHRDAVATPIKIADYREKADPDNYSGSLVSGRFVWDCFLLDTLNDGVHMLKDTAVGA